MLRFESLRYSKTTGKITLTTAVAKIMVFRTNPVLGAVGVMLAIVLGVSLLLPFVFEVGGVILAILPPESAVRSPNQMLPSGPTAKLSGAPAEISYSEMLPCISIAANLFIEDSLNQILPSGPAAKP